MQTKIAAQSSPIGLVFVNLGDANLGRKAAWMRTTRVHSYLRMGNNLEINSNSVLAVGKRFKRQRFLNMALLE